MDGVLTEAAPVTADGPPTPEAWGWLRPTGLRSRGLRATVVEGGTRALADHGPQVRGSVWLILTVAANAVGGFAFWLVAARLYESHQFGSAAALFTSVLFVNYATSLGLPVAIGRYAGDHSVGADRLFNWAILATTASSVAGSVLMYLALPEDVVEPLQAWGVGGAVALYALVSTGMSLTVIGEVRLMAMRRWGWVLGRAGLVALVRIPLLFWQPGHDEALWLFLLVAGIPALSGIVLAIVLSATGHGWSLRPLPASTRPAVRYANINYLGLLALQAPQFALPVIVLVNVSSTTMASFYVAFSITTVVFLVPHTMGQVLLVEGGKDQRDPRAQVRLSLLLATGLMVLATVGVAALSPLVTRIYGDAFAAAADALPWFVAASVPWAITSILLTSARVAEHRQAILSITGTLAVTTLVPALVLVPDHGVAGAVVAWISGNVCAAAVAVVLGRQDFHAPRA